MLSPHSHTSTPDPTIHNRRRPVQVPSRSERMSEAEANAAAEETPEPTPAEGGEGEEKREEPLNEVSWVYG